jgi:hypothetical protein
MAALLRTRKSQAKKEKPGFCRIVLCYNSSLKRGMNVKLDDKTLEYINVLSLAVIAISSVFIALWLSQILQILEVLGGNLGGISDTLFQLSEKI